MEEVVTGGMVIQATGNGKDGYGWDTDTDLR